VLADGRRLTREVRLTALVPSTEVPAAAWLGWDADRVGRGKESAPDGVLDHHFRLTLDFTAPQEVIGIAVFQADDRGVATERLHWNSADSAQELLAVERDGKLLNRGHVASLGRFSGPTQLDLYSNDLGSGAARGTAASATWSFTWEGTISRTATGLARHGEGTLTLRLEDQECFAGSWSSEPEL
jgi:hypothetical protein